MRRAASEVSYESTLAVAASRNVRFVGVGSGRRGRGRHLTVGGARLQVVEEPSDRRVSERGKRRPGPGDDGGQQELRAEQEGQRPGGRERPERRYARRAPRGGGKESAGVAVAEGEDRGRLRGPSQ